MLYSILGIFFVVIGILDLKFDYDTFTYLWLITGIIEMAIGTTILCFKKR
ncbi:MAG: hypothetical protein AB7V16_07110 [Vulcanibacillus sp.]